MKRFLLVLLTSFAFTSSPVFAMKRTIEEVEKQEEKNKKQKIESTNSASNSIVPFGDINFIYNVYDGFDFKKLNDKNNDNLSFELNHVGTENPNELMILHEIIIDESRELELENHPVWDSEIIDMDKVKKFMVFVKTILVRYQNNQDIDKNQKALQLQLSIPKSLQQKMAKYFTNTKFINKFFKAALNKTFDKKSTEFYDKVIQLLIDTPEFFNKLTNTNIDDAFYWACKNGHDEVLKPFIDTPELFNKLTSENINYAFGWACTSGHHKVVRLFIDTPKLLNKLTNEIINKAFYGACRYGNYKIVQLFIDTPKLLSQLTDKNINDSFCNHGYLKVFELFLERKDLAQKLSNKTLEEAIEVAENKKCKKLIQDYLDKQSGGYLP